MKSKAELKKLTDVELCEFALTEEGHKYEGKDFIILKDVAEELKRRKIREPIPLIPAPKTIILYPMTVKKKGESKILTLEEVHGVKPKEADLDKFYDHPLQARVVAVADDIEWKHLRVGSICLMKNPEQGVVRYHDFDYMHTHYSGIIALL